MIEAIEVAIHEGKILCGFPFKEDCKEYVRKNYPDIDAFDVEIKTQYLSPYNPGLGLMKR